MSCKRLQECTSLSGSCIAFHDDLVFMPPSTLFKSYLDDESVIMCNEALYSHEQNTAFALYFIYLSQDIGKPANAVNYLEHPCGQSLVFAVCINSLNSIGTW